MLCINIGSKTKGTLTIPGVFNHALAVRSISDLLKKTKKKENYFLREEILPKVAVCGAGLAGVELSLAYKKRWSDLFGREI